jgi:hypothetical protein
MQKFKRLKFELSSLKSDLGRLSVEKTDGNFVSKSVEKESIESETQKLLSELNQLENDESLSVFLDSNYHIVSAQQKETALSQQLSAEVINQKNASSINTDSNSSSYKPLMQAPATSEETNTVAIELEKRITKLEKAIGIASSPQVASFARANN